jgi:hypothetical protein
MWSWNQVKAAFFLHQALHEDGFGVTDLYGQRLPHCVQYTTCRRSEVKYVQHRDGATVRILSESFASLVSKIHWPILQWTKPPMGGPGPAVARAARTPGLAPPLPGGGV